MSSKIEEGDCFRVAGNMVIDNPIFLLCHGKVSGQGKLKGKRIWHAWNEDGDLVWDYSNGKKIIVRKERYYKIANIKEKNIVRYTRKEATELFIKHGTWGEFSNK